MVATREIATLSNEIKIRGRSIRIDQNGLVNLGDIWSAAGLRKNHKPHDWLRLEVTKRLVEAALARITGKSRNWTKAEIRSALYTKLGASGGSFADPRIALSYAEYLNADLALEVKEVYLRYTSNPVAFADETLARASAEANAWAGARALSRASRKEFTDTLKRHDVTPIGIGRATNGIYQGLFETTAAGLKKQRGLSEKANPRDHFSTKELMFTGAAEALAKEDIEESNHRGDESCWRASKDAGDAIREAVEKFRGTRQPKLPL